MSIVAVVGGGNIGTLMAGEFAARGHAVRMCASDAPRWSGKIEVLKPDGDVLCVGRLERVTSSLSEAIDGADWVFVTYPSSCFAMLAQNLVPLVQAGQRIVVVPGADAEFWFAGVAEKGAELLGLQRVHSIARLGERGRSVYQLGLKPSIQVGSIPSACAGNAAGELSELFAMPVEVLPNYLVETLTPSNPILHTSRLATMFGSWRDGVCYDGNIPFYETWDDASSELMIACDAELQALCRCIEAASGLDLTGVRPLTEHYESPNARAMTDKISHIPAFRGLGSPMKEVAPGKWVPDFSSRYFTADFAVGLRAIADLAEVFAVPHEHIASVLEWYETVGGVMCERVVTKDKDEVLGLYR